MRVETTNRNRGETIVHETKRFVAVPKCILIMSIGKWCNMQHQCIKCTSCCCFVSSFPIQITHNLTLALNIVCLDQCIKALDSQCDQPGRKCTAKVNGTPSQRATRANRVIMVDDALQLAGTCNYHAFLVGWLARDICECCQHHCDTVEWGRMQQAVDRSIDPRSLSPPIELGGDLVVYFRYHFAESCCSTITLSR